VRRFCAYFDRHYLTRGLALIRSVLEHVDAPDVHVLCLDDETHAALARLALPAVRLTTLAELESRDPALAAARSSRSHIEYVFTCKPAWIRTALESVDAGDLLTFVDADVLFFSSPGPVLAALDGASAGVVPHRFPAARSALERFGRYNAGVVFVRRDAEGTAIVDWWRARCLEWCHDRVEGDRFTDQRYLDQWPQRVRRLHVVAHPGVVAAPWNLSSFSLRTDRRPPLVDGEPLILFHFHGFRLLPGGMYDVGPADDVAGLSAATRAALYEPYVAAVRAAELELRRGSGDAPGMGPRRFGALAEARRMTSQLLRGRRTTFRVSRELR
jgi:hypothetical protein